MIWIRKHLYWKLNKTKLLRAQIFWRIPRLLPHLNILNQIFFCWKKKSASFKPKAFTRPGPSYDPELGNSFLQQKFFFEMSLH